MPAEADDRNAATGQAAPEKVAPKPAGVKFTFPSGTRPFAGYTLKRGIGRLSGAWLQG